MATRTQFVIKNTKVGLICKLFNYLINFISRTIFIRYLGNEVLGVNSLYTEILQMLSFVELGFGTAINYALYDPIAKNDEEKILQLLKLYKKIYITIAFVITLLGISLLPFLQYIVKGAEIVSLYNLRKYFILFLLNTVLSYFVAYKHSFVQAQQKMYLTTLIGSATTALISFIQIIVIVIFKNYDYYLITHTIGSIAANMLQSLYLNKKIPILKKKTERSLSKKEKKHIFSDVKALAVHQFSSVAVNATDNIIISSVSGLGILVVGSVSNYNLIINSVISVVAIAFGSIIAGFGNLVATSTKEKYYNAFVDMNFMSFWIYGFCAIAFFVLIPPFITLWLGEDFLINKASLFLIVICRYIAGQTLVYNNARFASGSFSKDYWVALVEAISNLAVSILLAMFMGLVGVYIGTLVSKLIYIICRPIASYKFIYDKSSLDYFKQFFLYLFSVVVVGSITYLATLNFTVQPTIISFLMAVIITAILPNLLFAIVFSKTRVFKSVVKRVKQTLVYRK